MIWKHSIWLCSSSSIEQKRKRNHNETLNCIQFKSPLLRVVSKNIMYGYIYMHTYVTTYTNGEREG